MHALAIGRKIVKNLHLAGFPLKGNGCFQSLGDVKEPLYDVEELRSIVPVDRYQSYDIRSIISRIVDGSEFDEFKKLYGTVSIGLSCLNIHVSAPSMNYSFVNIGLCLCRHWLQVLQEYMDSQ